MSFKVDLGTVKNGVTKDLSVNTAKQVSSAAGSCWCTSVKISGSKVSASIACHGNPGSTQTRTINGKYTDGEDFKIEVQFKIA
jgi:hypothetical protein